MQKEIIAAIAAYLEKESREVYIGENGITLDFGVKNPGHFTHAGFCKEFATEIAAAIALLVPVIEPKDYPFSELFNHMESEHGIILTDTELGDIIYIARK